MPKSDNKADTSNPHVWYTECQEDKQGEGCRHLAMGREGAIQAFLLHHGMMGYNGDLQVVDEGPITCNTERGAICFDSHCVLYGLSFKGETDAAK